MADLEDSAVSRRLVLKGAAAAAGAAGIAATTLGAMAGPAAEPVPSSSPATPDSRVSAEGKDADEIIVAHVRDVAAGEIDIYRGTTQTRLVDRELAARLAGI